MKIELTTAELQREKDFIREFHQLLDKYGYSDTPVLETNVYETNIDLSLRVDEDGFIATRISKKNKEGTQRITVKGSIVDVDDDEDPEFKLKRVAMNIRIIKLDESIKLHQRHDKVKAYKLDRDDNKDDEFDYKHL